MAPKPPDQPTFGEQPIPPPMFGEQQKPGKKKKGGTQQTSFLDAGSVPNVTQLGTKSLIGGD